MKIVFVVPVVSLWSTVLTRLIPPSGFTLETAMFLIRCTSRPPPVDAANPSFSVGGTGDVIFCSSTFVVLIHTVTKGYASVAVVGET